MTIERLEPEPWQALASFLNSTDRPAGLHRSFPLAGRSHNILQALLDPALAVGSEQHESGRELGQGLQALLDQLSVFKTISRCPILAITGMLNAGKSSLLATYLSPTSRPRVLRGLDNASGTHRFVLWLPSVWSRDAELLGALLGFLSDLFGHPPELLSEDAEEARAQYNGRVFAHALLEPPPQSSAALESATTATTISKVTSQAKSPRVLQAEPSAPSGVDPLAVPLLAYDDGLDALQLGLCDCPDIQTGFWHAGHERGDALARRRRDQLSRIGRLCSAFIVVSKMSSLHDASMLQVLTTLRDAMPGVPRLLAINKVKSRYAPETVAQETSSLLDRFGIRRVFVAYDFRSALAATRIPPPPHGIHIGDGQLPIFFEVDRPSATAVPATPVQHLDKTRYLFDLGQQLDAGTLSRETSRSLVVQLAAKTSAAMRWLERNHDLHTRQIVDAWQAIASACYEFMAERDASGRATGLRLQASPAIMEQMADSLRRTAPMWMRPSLAIDRTARQFHQAVASSAGRFKILQSASQSVADFTRRFRKGDGAQVLTPSKLAEAIRACDVHDAFQTMPKPELTACCEAGMKRFEAEDQILLDAEPLDAWSRQVWSQMSVKQKLWKGTQPLAVVTAPLLAAILVPIDGGGSAVLVFASIKELLAAAGIAAIIGPLGTGKEALDIIHRETPWRQLSDLFAIVCDSIGLPRPATSELPSVRCADELRRLQPSTLESKPQTNRPLAEVWELDTHGVVDLRLIVAQLSSL